MTTIRRGLTLFLVAFVAALPLVAVAADEETTTTTAEIEISATSTSSTTANTEDTGETDDSVAAGPDQPDETLPFTGTSTSTLANVAYAALSAGIALVALTHRNREAAKSD